MGSKFLGLALAAVVIAAPVGAAPSNTSGEVPLAAKPRVLAASFSGVISPVAAEFLQAAIHRAEKGGYDALVIELDTPGGLDLAMRDIVKAILSAEVPVIVYVSPAGGRAASAGVFITMAAHIAAMTPGTNIGAAHPVRLGGASGVKGGKNKPDPVMESKMTNDASAYLQSIATRRGRNVDWAREVVVKSTSVASGEAVRLNVVDLEAESLEALLNAIDGRELADFKGKPLRTKGAEVERFEMTRRQELLATVSDPNIAMMLMTIGVSGLLIELYSPGLILPGLVGVVSLILAFYSFQTLSADFAGVIFIMLGFLLYILELKIASFGLLALAGTGALLFGATMLFKDGGWGLQISWSAIAGSLVMMGIIMAALIYVTKQALMRRQTTGAEGMVGALVVTVTALDPKGKVSLGGELWKAESLEGTLPKGTEAVVDSTQGLTLMVKKSAG